MILQVICREILEILRSFSYRKSLMILLLFSLARCYGVGHLRPKFSFQPEGAGIFSLKTRGGIDEEKVLRTNRSASLCSAIT
jgi:hypothetical protein